MGIPFPHTLGYYQKQTYWFPCTWSQQDEFSSFVITDFCECFFLYPEPYSRKEKNMTRPKKDEQTVRSNSIHIRMNDTEYELLQERASAVNMSMAEFIRNALDNQQVTIKYELVADVPEIKKLIGEFGKIGSNLNQIARYFNQGGIISAEMRGEIKKCIRDIYEMKYEVIKMAGDFRGSD
jgi:hypothetical protein